MNHKAKISVFSSSLPSDNFSLYKGIPQLFCCFFPRLLSMLQLSVGRGTLSVVGQIGEHYLFSFIQDTYLENRKLYRLI